MSIKVYQIALRSVDLERVYDCDGGKADAMLLDRDCTVVVVEHGKKSSIECDAAYYACMDWCEGVIGQQGERWASAGYTSAYTDIFLFLDFEQAVAFRLRWHGSVP